MFNVLCDYLLPPLLDEDELLDEPPLDLDDEPLDLVEEPLDLEDPFENDLPELPDDLDPLPYDRDEFDLLGVDVREGVVDPLPEPL